MSRPKPVVLTIMDGVGHNPDPKNNAVAMAHKPNLDRYWKTFPSTDIRTDGHFVGLPDGQFGNSEVGHLNIGSGRVIKMDITRIDDMVANGTLKDNPALQGAMAHGRSHQLHIMGLCSMGGVHAQLTHILGLVEMAKAQGVERVFLHCFTDGRDTPPTSGAGYLEQVQKRLDELGVGKIATVIGRYYAMDRDKRWERTEKAFNAIVLGEGRRAGDPVAALKQSYETKDSDGKYLTDEFVDPIVIVDESGEPVGRIRDEDAVIFANFRADRARQITLALTSPDLERPSREKAPKNLHYVTMTEYDKSYTFPVVISKFLPEHVLGQVCEAEGWRNLRTAETEKYPHVTYFFNGGIEKAFRGEEREMVASPKVATYDLQPEMSAAGVCDVVVKAIEKGDFDLIIVNFANGDMVGHTGVIPAAVKAVETVDACLGRIEEALKPKDFSWLITADHGNADLMVDPNTGEPHTYHTTFPVPFILASNWAGQLRTDGSLRDIAPTILGLLGVDLPAEMSGRDLRILE
ncbi:MAG: 2,3-bisphosphoglycerate-independent phosphoglycerate mutase [Acidobacteria bacterium]|nr:2,3-bisphosphoglycerate-independent phosphoglycerate mutase [Acidobacteriota bacterium]